MATHPNEIFKKHRLSVDDYHRMGEAGILKQQDRVELIEGEIADMAPIGSRHNGIVMYLNRLFVKALGDLCLVEIQGPIILGNNNAPQPDLALLKPRDDFYKNAHPTSTDILLIVEVADSSLRFDRDIKIPLYAKHNIPEVWLVDLENNKLTSFSLPVNGQYSQEQSLDQSNLISIDSIPGIHVDLANLFLT